MHPWFSVSRQTAPSVVRPGGNCDQSCPNPWETMDFFQILAKSMEMYGVLQKILSGSMGIRGILPESWPDPWKCMDFCKIPARIH